MRFAAGWFSILVEKEPILKPAAYILVLAIAIELLVQHFLGIEKSDLTRFAITVSINCFLSHMRISNPCKNCASCSFGWRTGFRS